MDAVPVMSCMHVEEPIAEPAADVRGSQSADARKTEYEQVECRLAVMYFELSPSQIKIEDAIFQNDQTDRKSIEPV